MIVLCTITLLLDYSFTPITLLGIVVREESEIYTVDFSDDAQDRFLPEGNYFKIQVEKFHCSRVK